MWDMRDELSDLPFAHSLSGADSAADKDLLLI